jgi:peptide/nickel transport system permease protein
MLQYTIRRLLLMIPTLFLVSVVAFIVIQLPPGDFVTHYIATLGQSADLTDMAKYESLRRRYGLDQPLYVQYFKWMRNWLKGDWGRSLQYQKPVKELIGGRILLTLMISVVSLLTVWIFAFPVGIYSAVKQYSLGDHLFTTISFLGVGTPSFLLALVIMYAAYRLFGLNVVGLLSREYQDAPWSIDKVVDLLQHIWVPLLILSLTNTAGLIRTMRALLLDELHKPYVVTARAKGLKERKVILKYPVRVALNAFVSTVGWTLPHLISSTTIVAVVLGLPTTGPLLLQALKAQDMYLAASFLVLLSILTIVGTFLSDILLAWLDPRIRLMEGQGSSR